MPAANPLVLRRSHLAPRAPTAPSAIARAIGIGRIQFPRASPEYAGAPTRGGASTRRPRTSVGGRDRFLSRRRGARGDSGSTSRVVAGSSCRSPGLSGKGRFRDGPRLHGFGHLRAFRIVGFLVLLKCANTNRGTKVETHLKACIWFPALAGCIRFDGAIAAFDVRGRVHR